MFGAIGMMLALYKCGAQWKTAGSTIVGYFLMGYTFPSNVYYGSVRPLLTHARLCRVRRRTKPN